MKDKLKVLFVTAEAAPYAQAGGLGEVSAALPQALFHTGEMEIRRVMPLYKQTQGKAEYVKDFPVPMGLLSGSLETQFETGTLMSDSNNSEVPTWFIGNHRYFYRDNIYGYEDDGFRFFFFCRAVIEMLKTIPWKPQILHLNDWHMGFLALLVKREFPEIKTVLTIHNISYDGFIPSDLLGDLLSDRDRIRLGWPEWLSFMKAGLIYSDKVTTVSPTYSREIRQAESNSIIVPYLRQRQDEIIGILNGIDIKQYHPGEDGVQPFPYHIGNAMENKRKNRSVLGQQLHLPDKDIPLISMVTRLNSEKGMDLVVKALPNLDLDTFQMVVMGSGNPYYEGLLADFAERYPETLVFLPEYSFDLARRIYGASDIYLMPSQYEPCGIGQLYAMRYGTVPVVNPVGGLVDTVVNIKDSTSEENLETGTGFYMDHWSGTGLVSILEKAIQAWHTPRWESYIRNCMNVDSSWQSRIDQYIKVYRSLFENDIGD